MQKKMFMLLFVFLFYLNFKAQNQYFDSYPGIPLVANTWGATPLVLGNQAAAFNNLTQLGLNAIVCQSVTPSLLDASPSSLFFIPYQASTSRGVVYYSQRVYVEWEAEGDPTVKINLKKGGVPFQDNDGVKGIKNSNSNPECLAWGPNYSQPATTTINKERIGLNAKFVLKIVDKQSRYRDPVVCTIRVKSNSNTLASATLMEHDFINGEWKSFVLAYNTSTNPYPVDPMATWPNIPDVEFEVSWAGVSNMDLYFDKVIVYDEDGEKLMNNDPDVLDSIQSELTYLGASNSSSKVIAMAPIDEPIFFDLYSGLHKLDLLVSELTNNKLTLFSSLPAAWPVYSIIPGTSDTMWALDESFMRAKYRGLKINNYMFNNPYTVGQGHSDIERANITHWLYGYLSRVNDLDDKFFCSVQAGMWKVPGFTDVLIDIPTRVQFLYNVNTALLYGAKGIELNNYYYTTQDSVERGVTALVNYNPSTKNINYVSSLYNTIKNEVSPRLKGAYGKLLKKLNQIGQNSLDELSPWGYLYDSEDNYIARFLREDLNEYDYGAFENIALYPDKKFIMAVSRHYNEDNDNPLEIEIPSTANKNYTVKEYYNNEVSSVYPITTTLTFNQVIAPGEAALLEIAPAVKYGGAIIGNETISSNVTMLNDLAVNQNKVLTVSGSGITYTLQDTLRLKTTASLICQNGAKINGSHGNIIFEGTGVYTSDNWSQSLFYTNENGHPKLVWGQWVLGITQVYKIYSVIGGESNLVATVTSTYANPIQSYVLSGLSLIESGGASRTFKVSRVKNGVEYFTNTVTFLVPGVSIEKELSDITIQDFEISQNYPNPFNPTTQISYSIPEAGKVSIKLYDVLGREVMDLFNGMREMGSYNVTVDGSNLASGLYIYRVQYNNKVLSKKMLLLK